MFKNMIVYRIAPPWQMGLEEVEAALQKALFQECGATQEQSSGFVPPRGDAHGLLAEIFVQPLRPDRGFEQLVFAAGGSGDDAVVRHGADYVRRA